MGRLILAEIEQGVTQPKVGKVQFVGTVDVTLAFHVKASNDLHEVGFPYQLDVVTNGRCSEGRANALENLGTGFNA